MSKISIILERDEAEELDSVLYYAEELTSGHYLLEKVRKQIEEQI